MPNLTVGFCVLGMAVVTGAGATCEPADGPTDSIFTYNVSGNDYFITGTQAFECSAKTDASGTYIVSKCPLPIEIHSILSSQTGAVNDIVTRMPSQTEGKYCWCNVRQLGNQVSTKWMMVSDRMCGDGSTPQYKAACGNICISGLFGFMGGMDADKDMFLQDYNFDTIIDY